MTLNQHSITSVFKKRNASSDVILWDNSPQNTVPFFPLPEFNLWSISHHWSPCVTWSYISRPVTLSIRPLSLLKEIKGPLTVPWHHTTTSSNPLLNCDPSSTYSPPPCQFCAPQHSAVSRSESYIHLEDQCRRSDNLLFDRKRQAPAKDKPRLIGDKERGRDKIYKKKKKNNNKKIQRPIDGKIRRSASFRREWLLYPRLYRQLVEVRAPLAGRRWLMVHPQNERGLKREGRWLNGAKSKHQQKDGEIRKEGHRHRCDSQGRAVSVWVLCSCLMTVSLFFKIKVRASCRLVWVISIAVLQVEMHQPEENGINSKALLAFSVTISNINPAREVGLLRLSMKSCTSVLWSSDPKHSQSVLVPKSVFF